MFFALTPKGPVGDKMEVNKEPQPGTFFFKAMNESLQLSYYTIEG